MLGIWTFNIISQSVKDIHYVFDEVMNNIEGSLSTVCMIIHVFRRTQMCELFLSFKIDYICSVQ